jgi:hypothetical protein
MKTVELPGLKVDDVGSIWYDLLKKDFDVEAVGVNSDATFVYMADDEEKDPRPIVESWVGKASVQMSLSAIDGRRKAIMVLLANVQKCRAERAASRAAAEAERHEREKAGHPELKVSSTGQAGMFGVVEVLSNGVDSHTILIQKVDPAGNVVDGSEGLSVTTSHKVALSDAAPKLSDGMAMIQVGPSAAVGDFVIEVQDRSGNMKSVKLPLRFVRQRTDQGASPAPPVLEKNGSIMTVIRRLLGI